MARQGFWYWNYHVFTQREDGIMSSVRMFDDQPPAGSTATRLIGRVTVVTALNAELEEELTWPLFTGVCSGPAPTGPIASIDPSFMGQRWMWWEMIHATATDTVSTQTTPRGSFGRVSVAVDVSGQRTLPAPSHLWFVTQTLGGGPGGIGYQRVMAHWRALILYP